MSLLAHTSNYIGWVFIGNWATTNFYRHVEQNRKQFELPYWVKSGNFVHTRIQNVCNRSTSCQIFKELGTTVSFSNPSKVPLVIQQSRSTKPVLGRGCVSKIGVYVLTLYLWPDRDEIWIINLYYCSQLTKSLKKSGRQNPTINTNFDYFSPPCWFGCTDFFCIFGTSVNYTDTSFNEIEL